jgi:hypothetical protein
MSRLLSALQVPAGATFQDEAQLARLISQGDLGDRPTQQRTFILLGSREPEASRAQSRPPVQFTDQVIGGPALSKEEIQRVIRANQLKIRYCYERELAKTPKLIAKVTPKFSINEDGAVSGVNMGSAQQQHPALAQCVKKHIEGMKFPKPRGGALIQVSYPFVFHPE